MNAPFPPPADTSTIKLRVLSLGAGVQSTTLALMAAHDAVGRCLIAPSSPIKVTACVACSHVPFLRRD